MKHLPSVPSSTRKPWACTIRSDDGNVSFALAPLGAGLFVERVQVRSSKDRTFHSAFFRDDKSFESWCDADPIRFEYPLVYVRLRRDGHALLRRAT